jgi:hypothetical protein
LRTVVVARSFRESLIRKHDATAERCTDLPHCLGNATELRRLRRRDVKPSNRAFYAAVPLYKCDDQCPSIRACVSSSFARRESHAELKVRQCRGKFFQESAPSGRIARFCASDARNLVVNYSRSHSWGLRLEGQRRCPRAIIATHRAVIRQFPDTYHHASSEVGRNRRGQTRVLYVSRLRETVGVVLVDHLAISLIAFR